MLRADAAEILDGETEWPAGCRCETSAGDCRFRLASGLSRVRSLRGAKARRVVDASGLVVDQDALGEEPTGHCQAGRERNLGRPGPGDLDGGHPRPNLAQQRRQLHGERGEIEARKRARA